MNAHQKAELKQQHDEYRDAEADYRSIVGTGTQEEVLAAFSRLVAASRAVQEESPEAHQAADSDR